MMLRSSIVLVSLLILGGPAIAAPPWRLEVLEVKRVQATLNYRVQCDKLNAKEWIFFAGHAPELPGQVKVKHRLESAGRPTTELSDMQRVVQVGRVPASSPGLRTTLPVVVVYEATLRSRH